MTPRSERKNAARRSARNSDRPTRRRLTNRSGVTPEHAMHAAGCAATAAPAAAQHRAGQRLGTGQRQHPQRRADLAPEPAGRDQHEPVDPVRVVVAEVDGDRAAERVPADRRRLQLERVHEPVEQQGEVVEQVQPARRVRRAVPEQVDRDRAQPARRERHEIVGPRPAVGQQAVDEQHDRRARVAALEVGDAVAVDDDAARARPATMAQTRTRRYAIRTPVAAAPASRPPGRPPSAPPAARPGWPTIDASRPRRGSPTTSRSRAASRVSSALTSLPFTAMHSTPSSEPSAVVTNSRSVALGVAGVVAAGDRRGAGRRASARRAAARWAAARPAPRAAARRAASPPRRPPQRRGRSGGRAHARPRSVMSQPRRGGHAALGASVARTAVGRCPRGTCVRSRRR